VLPGVATDVRAAAVARAFATVAPSAGDARTDGLAGVSEDAVWSKDAVWIGAPVPRLCPPGATSEMEETPQAVSKARLTADVKILKTLIGVPHPRISSGAARRR